MGLAGRARLLLTLAIVAVIGLALVATGAIGKIGARPAALKPVVVTTRGHEIYLKNPTSPPNRLDAVTLGWYPGTITVHSGQKLTLVDKDNFGEPHVLVISPKKYLPNRPEAPSKNPVIRLVAQEVLNNPSNPQDGFKTLEANRGKPGLNTTGDALVLLHKGSKITWFVSAKPGTTLYYFCAVHLWMHGEIKVVK